MNEVITIVPDDALLLDIAQQAHANGLQLIDNGKRWALCRTVPAGWKAVPLNVAALERRAA